MIITKRIHFKRLIRRYKLKCNVEPYIDFFSLHSHSSFVTSSSLFYFYDEHNSLFYYSFSRLLRKMDNPVNIFVLDILLEYYCYLYHCFMEITYVNIYGTLRNMQRKRDECQVKLDQLYAQYPLQNPIYSVRSVIDHEYGHDYDSWTEEEKLNPYYVLGEVPETYPESKDITEDNVDDELEKYNAYRVQKQKEEKERVITYKIEKEEENRLEKEREMMESPEEKEKRLRYKQEREESYQDYENMMYWSEKEVQRHLAREQELKEEADEKEAREQQKEKNRLHRKKLDKDRVEDPYRTHPPKVRKAHIHRTAVYKRQKTKRRFIAHFDFSEYLHS